MKDLLKIFRQGVDIHSIKLKKSRKSKSEISIPDKN